MFSIKHTWSAKTVSGIATLALVASMFATLVPMTASAASLGPNNADIFTNVDRSGAQSWSNPNRAETSNDSRAEVSLSEGSDSNRNSDYLQATDFDFAVPVGSTINGIEVKIKRSASQSNEIRDEVVQLIKNGSRVGDDKATGSSYDWGTSDTVVTYGGTSDLWGTTWTVADVNNTNFGFAFAARHENENQNATARVDHMTIKVYYTAPVDINICHKTGNNWEPKTVNESALSGHLGHGDFIVDSENPCPPVVDACPLVDGNQASSPCASDCQVGEWNQGTQQCETPAPELCTDEDANNEGLPLPCTYPTTPEEMCDFHDGIWNVLLNKCIESSGDGEDITCFIFDLLGLPCDSEEEQCEDANKFWNSSTSECENWEVCEGNEELNLNTNECEEDGGGQTDACPNEDTDPGVQETGPCNADADVCPNDSGVQTDPSECTPTPPSNGGGSNGGGGGRPHYAGTPSSVSWKGEVAGASTDMCSPLLITYMGLGRTNDSAEVMELQTFLNTELGLTLEVSGIFDEATEAAVKAFQLKYKVDVLMPWLPFGLAEDTATGYVYKTTQRMINNIHCATLNIPMPLLP